MTPPRAADGGGRSAPVFPGAGEMAARCRAFDWAATPLGPADAWPVSLRTTVALLLAARHPMILFWGPERVQLYNDAYIPALGGADRHPAALGVRAQAFWTGAMWDLVGPQLAHVLATGEATWHEDQEVALPRGGGTEQTYWTYSYTPAADDAGRVAGVLVIAQETTARVRGERALRTAGAALKREQARLADVFRQSPAFLAVLRGPTHVFDLVNDAYSVLVGHRALVGQPIGEALPEAQAQGFVALLDEVLATGTPFVGREVPITLARAGGPEERFVDFVYLPLVEADGAGGAARVGVIAHGTDVTAQVVARREVERLLAASEATRAGAEAARADAEQARERATEANRAKIEFMATMSHELRTPLNAIGGYAELIQLGVRGPVTAEQQTDLERLQRAQRHLLGLINGVLNFAKVGLGVVTYEVADVPLDEVLATCEALIAPQARAKALRVTYAACHPTLRVRADPEKLRQIVLNLLTNAVKFTEPGGQVALACAEAPDRAGAGRTVRVQVRDTGIGIAPGDLRRAFEPFVQLDARLTRTQEGTGLGLAISRDLARGMGGDLTAESAPGVGSTFTLTLPAA